MSPRAPNTRMNVLLGLQKRYLYLTTIYAAL